MTIPVYINQEPAGTLSVSQSGLYTVLEANADARGLVRLWVHGGGKSAYLGIMEPKDGGLYLRRRLSRRELAAFPAPIESVSDREEEETLHNEVDIKGDLPAEDPEQTEAAPPESEPEPDSENLHNAQTDARACPWPAEVPEDGLLWYRRTDGSLSAFDGVSSLLAIPAALRAPGGRAAERVIEGKKYLVFRY